ncbi:MAG: methylamine utilization protein MauE [Alphaproteobacteria bacterium]|nr:methylamine utilization protein MauE [Alphaproteobacteria bacterium]
MNGQLPAIIGLAAAVACALLLLVAGVDKLRHRALLPGVIANYRLLPAGLVAPAALLLPAAELAVAGGLLLGLRPWAPLAAMLLLLLFAAAMAINIGRGRRHIDCGCGHVALRQQLGWGQVGRNLLLASALLPGLAPLPAGLGPAAVAVAVAAGVVAWLFLILFEQLRALAASAPGQLRG